MLTKYIGEDEEWHNLLPSKTIELKNSQLYDVDFQIEGPQMIVNGQPVIAPDSTIWCVFPDGVKIPYAANLLENFWEVK